MRQSDWLLLDKQVENLEEEVLGFPNDKVLKVLYWLEDNQMLNFSGQRLVNKYTKKNSGK